MEGLDGNLSIFAKTTAEKNVVGLVGLQKGLDDLVADATVAGGDEDNLCGRSCCYLLSRCRLRELLQRQI